MPKRNNKESYWLEREKDNLTVELMKDAEVSAEMKRIVEHAMDTCQKEIESFYTRYADKEGLTVAEAKKLVSEYDVIAHQNMAKQYVEQGRNMAKSLGRNVKYSDFSDEVNKRMRLYNVTMRVNREELLLAALNTHLIAATSKIEMTMDDYLNDGAVRELERQAGLLGNISVKRSDIHAIVNASYHDATWSERLWDNMDEVRKIVDEAVIDTVLRGRHPNESVKRLRELTGRSEYEARRLLISEVSRVQTEMRRLSYEELDVEQYKYVAVLDNRTTPTCKSLNGKVFDVFDMKVGINAPPMHQFCRSTTIPTKREETDDWDEADGDLFIDDEQIEAEADAENDAISATIDDIMKRLDALDKDDIERVENKLNQAKKIGKKVNITDQAIDKVKLVDIPTHSDEENQTIQLMHKQLLQDSKENNDSNEVAYILTKNNPIVVYGTQTDVEFSGEAAIHLNNSLPGTVTMLHNHPGLSSFSLNDIQMFLLTDSIKTLTIVTNVGTIKYITKTDEYSKGEFIRIYNTVIGDLPIENITSDIIEILLKMLYDAGIILYKVR